METIDRDRLSSVLESVTYYDMSDPSFLPERLIELIKGDLNLVLP